MSGAELGLGLPTGLTLGSPFNTPTAKRHLRSDSSVSVLSISSPHPPTPRRRPRDPSFSGAPVAGPSVASSSAASGSTPTPTLSKRSHRRNPSLGDVFARMTAANVLASAVMDAEGIAETEHEDLESDALNSLDESKGSGSGLGDMPIEILQLIHMLADNPSLPATSRYLHHALTNASTTYIARYMIFQYRRDGARQVLTSAVRRPIVSLPVAKEMVRLWDLERGHSRHATNSPFSAASGSSTPTTPCTPQRQRTTAPALEVTQLPRRLFRRKPAEGQPAIDPFITWLFTHWDFDLKRKGHRPLVYSVINQNYELVEFLLRRGADPRNSDEFAVRAAVQKKDLRMVRLLVEPFEDESNEQPDDSLPLPSPRSRKRPRAEEATPKRKDRVPINQTHVQLALEHGTPEIVDYFVHEKGATPNLNDIMAIGGQRTRRRHS